MKRHEMLLLAIVTILVVGGVLYVVLQARHDESVTSPPSSPGITPGYCYDDGNGQVCAN